MTQKPIIGFAGMTHLGLNSAVASAEKGFYTLCFDPNTALIQTLQQGKTSINEPDLSELMQKNAKGLEFTSNTADLKKCDIVYISMDVPTDDKGASDLTPIRAMIETVNKALADDALLIVLCQVPPGFTRTIARPAATLYYQVETLIFGRAMERALFPERYIIGCANPKALDPRYKAYLEAYGCPLLPMRYESAELAKTAINLFLAAQVCTANTLAEVCEKIGADWLEIIPSLRLDKRIGQHAYIEPGLGLSGGNIERDLQTVSEIGYEKGAKVAVPLSYIEHSKYRKQWSIRTFYEHYNNTIADFKVGVLGLAYKINTHSVKNSPAIDLINALPDIAVQAYDPVVKSVNIGKTIDIHENALSAAKGIDMLFIMTPWDEFKKLDWNALKSAMRGKIIVDPFRLVPESEAYTHLVLGKA